MVRPIIAAFLVLGSLGSLCVGSIEAEDAPSFKNFSSFRQIAPGVDFYASNRQVVAPFEKPVNDAVARLKSLLGSDLPKGAVFVCSTLDQKDSIYEPRVLRAGYGWLVVVVTPEVQMQEAMERMKSQLGGAMPADMVRRMREGPPPGMMANMEKQNAAITAEQIARATIQAKFAKDQRFRSSRIDDTGRSPLPDWLDMGISTYVGGSAPNLSYLQQNMDQTFPLEDVLSMSRPFVASSSSGPGGNGAPPGGMMAMRAGGGGFPGGGAPGGGGAGGFRMGSGGRQGGSQRTVPKDEQDRMLFDGQSGSFFEFLLGKIGIERTKQLIKLAAEGQESRDYLAQPDVLGSDFEKIEDEWAGWVKTLKPQQASGNPGQFRP